MTRKDHIRHALDVVYDQIRWEIDHLHALYVRERFDCWLLFTAPLELLRSFVKWLFRYGVIYNVGLAAGRHIRHSRNIPGIVCGGCCACCGFFRRSGKVSLPSIFKIVPVKTPLRPMAVRLARFGRRAASEGIRWQRVALALCREMTYRQLAEKAEIGPPCLTKN
jgi:hypothetical protein